MDVFKLYNKKMKIIFKIMYTRRNFPHNWYGKGQFLTLFKVLLLLNVYRARNRTLTLPGSNMYILMGSQWMISSQNDN
jgi:hypothetical protein